MDSVALFDLDGTLVDSREIIYQCMKHALVDTYGLSLTREQLLSGVGLTLLEQMNIFCPHDPEGAAHAYRSYFFDQGSPLAPAYPGIDEQLKTLRSQGVRMAVITSKHKQTAYDNLKGVGIENYFEYLLSPEDTTKHKPDPEPLRICAQKMGVDLGCCVYIGDSPFDIQAASSAPMKNLGVTWGFFNEKELRDAGADQICTEVSLLAQHIINSLTNTQL